MKKTLKFAGLLLCGILLLGLGTGNIHARIGDNDAWCVGAAGAEVCVDSSGNIAPTTDNDATLGTSALRWATAYILDIIVGDDLTVAGDLFNTPLASQVLGAGGTINLAGACGKLVRVSVTADRTTDTTDTFTAPAAATTGCHYTLVNGGGGTITLDDNAKFNVPANVVLGTGDGALVVQSSDTEYTLIGTSDN